MLSFRIRVRVRFRVLFDLTHIPLQQRPARAWGWGKRIPQACVVPARPAGVDTKATGDQRCRG